MENANSPEYLEKIKNQLIENLRRTAHVPSVQMQDVPRHSMGAMSDEDDAELDDLDEDENKDVRITQRQWEQRIERDDEYEASDNEEMEKANGIHRNGTTRRTFQDYRNSDVENDSGVATPLNGTADSIIKSKETDEVMKDVEDTEEAEAEPSDAAADSKADEKKSSQEAEAQEGVRKESREEAADGSKAAKEGDKTDKATASTQDSTEKPDQAPKDDDEVMQDAETRPKESEKETEKKASTEPEPAKSSQAATTDKDGDVDMDEASANRQPNEKSAKSDEVAGTASSSETAENSKEPTSGS
jgi:histone deacetylase 1/2